MCVFVCDVMSEGATLLQKYNQYDLNWCKLHGQCESRNWSRLRKREGVWERKGGRVEKSEGTLYCQKYVDTYPFHIQYFCVLFVTGWSSWFGSGLVVPIKWNRNATAYKDISQNSVLLTVATVWKWSFPISILQYPHFLWQTSETISKFLQFP